MRYGVIYSVFLVVALMAMNAGANGQIKSFSIVEDSTISETSTSNGKGGGSKKKQVPSNSIVLKVDTISGDEYQLQGCGGLVGGVWENIGDVFTATDSSTTLSFPESETYSFFRVVVVAMNSIPPPPPPPPPPPSYT